MEIRNFIRNSIRNHLNEQNNSFNNLNDNFWKWFSDSKIVENGKPMIVYHGSPIKNIENFDFSKIGYNKGNYGHYGYGVYFSTDVREAKTYGKNIYECYIRMLKPFIGSERQILQLKQNGVSGIDELVPISIDFTSFKESFKNEPEVFKFIDNIEKMGLEKTWDIIRNGQFGGDIERLNDISNLIEYTTLNKNVNGVPDYAIDELKQLGIKPKINKGFPYEQSLHWITDLGNKSKEVTEIIQKLGYDGVFYGSEIVVFEPNQIKSVNNNGKWSLDNDNIYN